MRPASCRGSSLVTFPAASTILTDPDEYDLSSSQYGTLFLPQVVTAIAAALLGAGLAGRFGTKRVYLAGLMAGLVSMALLLVSQFFTDDTAVAFALLLLATACLGVGFGLDRARPEHVDGGVPPGPGRPGRPGPQRIAWLRHRAGPRLRRRVRRARVLVGAAADDGDPPHRAPARQRAPPPAHRSTQRDLAGQRADRDPARGSGCTPDSPCCTASARRSTATGPSWI